MKKLTKPSLCILIISVLIFPIVFIYGQQTAYEHPIIYPWRSTKSIVKSGDSLTILFLASGTETVETVKLKGPYNEVDLNIYDQFIGEFIADPWGDGGLEGQWKLTGNLKISVIIPDCPKENYDLIVKTDQREVISRKAVTKINEYKNPYTFVHVSDAHLTRDWVGSATTGYPPSIVHIDRIIDAVNIIGPEFVISTGDNIMDYTNNYPGNDITVDKKWDIYYDGWLQYQGFHDLDAPFFSVIGNHDFFQHNIEYSNLKNHNLGRGLQIARTNGLGVQTFSYGNTSFAGFDDNFRDGNKPSIIDLNAIEKYLNREGAGNFRILGQHQPNHLDDSFLSRNKIDLAWVGHFHSNGDGNNGNTRVLRTANAGRPIGDDPGWFRVVTIDNRSISTQVMKYGDNKTETPLLTLSYANPNNGTINNNSATIQNGFNISWPHANIRFVMPKGSYSVQGGTVEQAFQGDQFSIYNVRTVVPASSNITVQINFESATPVDEINSKTPTYKEYSLLFKNQLIPIKIQSKIFFARIYNLEGSLIQKIEPKNFKLNWDGKNRHGTEVVNGIYAVQFITAKGIEKIKMAVTQ